MLGTEEKMEIKHSLLRTFIHPPMESIGELFAVYFPGCDPVHMCFNYLITVAFPHHSGKKGVYQLTSSWKDI